MEKNQTKLSRNKINICALKTKYDQEIKPALKKHFQFSSIMNVPTITKVVLNMGLKDAVTNSGAIKSAQKVLTLIGMQKAIVTKAKKSISAFKIRGGMPLGVKVTLRNKKMWYFLEKLIHVGLPRVRDFRGLSWKSFSKFGNYSIGIKENIIFPEINYEVIDKIRGLDICIVTSTNKIEEAYQLMLMLGFPFKKRITTGKK